MHRLRVDARIAGELNRAMVFELVRAREVVSRIGLARETGLSKATISQIVDSFIQEGFIQTVGPGESEKGRRPMLLRFSPGARWAAGVEFSDTTCGAVLIDLDGAVIRSASSSIRAPSARGAVEAAAALVSELIADLAPGKLVGIGIGTPGLVDSRRGIIQMAPDLGWTDVPVGAPFADQFGLPITCLNRAKAAAFGEAWCGAGDGVDNLVYLSVSTGVSAGMVIGQRLYRGVSMSEGEVGHVTVLPDGPLCACGNRGCLQTVAAGPAILARIREELRKNGRAGAPEWSAGTVDLLSLEMLGEVANEGDQIIAGVLDEAAEYLGIAAANLVNTLNPGMLILGGAVIRALPGLVPRVEAVIRRRALSVPAAAVKVVPSALGRTAVPIGAAAFLLSQVSVVGASFHPADGHLSTTHVIEPARSEGPGSPRGAGRFVGLSIIE